MKILLIILMVVAALIVGFLAYLVLAFGDEEIQLHSWRKFLVPLAFMLLAIMWIVYYDLDSVLTETTVTDLPLSLYVEDGKPDEPPLGFYVETLELKTVPKTYYSFCYYDTTEQKVLKGKVLQEQNVEFIVNPSVEPTLRMVEARVRHKITGREYVVPYYIFIIPNLESLHQAGSESADI